MVAVTMHVRGKRPVSELAGALTDLDLVEAVVASDHQAADELDLDLTCHQRGPSLLTNLDHGAVSGSAEKWRTTVRSARTPCCVERACVVGTTTGKGIPLPRLPNPSGADGLPRSADRGFGHGAEDRDQLVRGGQAQDLGHRCLR
jgi:hypothetical protein